MTKEKKYNVAVVGATGAVGREMISILEERKFPVKDLTLLASSKSAGEKLEFCGSKRTVQGLKEDSFKGIEIALFSAGGVVSQKFAPLAAKAGAVVIDNTNAFRMEPDVPLVVPEVNPQTIEGFVKRRIIANPNCSTIQMVVALKPIHDTAGLERVVVSTYQATSGAGQKGMDELSDQVSALLNQREFSPKAFPHPIAFNCLPHIDVFLENGYTKEEMKVIQETKKILGDETIRVTATTVRVPVFCSHAESVTIETKKKITAAEVRKILTKAPGVCVQDDPSRNIYPLQIQATGKDEVFVGRIREDISVPNGIHLWIVADNLRKGAALNAIQIGEILVQKYI